MANDNVIWSVVTDWFPLKRIPPNAHQCYKFKEVSLPLVSIRKWCVHGMKVHFDEHHVKVYNRENKLLIVGHHDPLRNLNIIPIEGNGDDQPRVNKMEPRVPNIPRALTAPRLCLTQPYMMQHQAANACKICQVLALISYLHATAGWILKETLLVGIKEGFYCSWPELTAPRVQAHLKKTEPTTFGHQKLV